MTVKYTVLARPNPQNPEAPIKYYPFAVSSGRVTLPDIMERIAGFSTVSSVDGVALVEALLIVIPLELARGNLVELGDLGTFGLRLRGEGTDSEEEVTPNKVLVSFRPGKRFKQILEQVDFERA